MVPESEILFFDHAKICLSYLVNKPRLMQEIILKSEMGVSRLMDVLVDAREVLRNDALLLLIQLTKGHANLQKIVAFENAFDKLCDIIETVIIILFNIFPPRTALLKTGCLLILEHFLCRMLIRAHFFFDFEIRLMISIRFGIEHHF